MRSESRDMRDDVKDWGSRFYICLSVCLQSYTLHIQYIPYISRWPNRLFFIDTGMQRDANKQRNTAQLRIPT